MRKFSLQARHNMSEARKRAIKAGRVFVPSRKGIPNSEAQKRKISQTLTGRKHTWGNKIGLALKGKSKSEEHKKKLSETKKEQCKEGLVPHIGAWGERNHMWKDDVGYSALHGWMRRRLGKALVCTQCFSTYYVEWANISGEYVRDLRDWIQLCRKCHKTHDRILRKAGKSMKNIFDKQGRRVTP